MVSSNARKVDGKVCHLRDQDGDRPGEKVSSMRSIGNLQLRLGTARLI